MRRGILLVRAMWPSRQVRRLENGRQLHFGLTAKGLKEETAIYGLLILRHDIQMWLQFNLLLGLPLPCTVHVVPLVIPVTPLTATPYPLILPPFVVPSRIILQLRPDIVLGVYWLRVDLDGVLSAGRSFLEIEVKAEITSLFLWFLGVVQVADVAKVRGIVVIGYLR